jgi:hypothetical protein
MLSLVVMDPLTLASTLATLVQLLGQFKDERQTAEVETDATIDEYLEWLRRNNHEQLVGLINNHIELSQSLEELIQGQHSELLSKLGQIGDAIGQVSAQVQAIAKGSDASPRSAELSPQAISMLRQMAEANATSLLELKSMRGTQFRLRDANGKSLRDLNVEDQRFIDDDLATLDELGLLALEFTDQGYRRFRLTRAGASVGESQQNARPDFEQYMDGLDATELWHLAKALHNQNQNMSFGRAETTGPRLASKGLLEKVPFDPPSRAS